MRYLILFGSIFVSGVIYVEILCLILFANYIQGLLTVDKGIAFLIALSIIALFCALIIWLVSRNAPIMEDENEPEE
jgi:hypothetical protein